MAKDIIIRPADGTLKFSQDGTLFGSPTDGMIEYDGSFLYLTSGTTRDKIMTSNRVSTEEISMDVSLTDLTTIYVDDYAWYAYTITSASLRTLAGTCTLTFKINGTNVVGLVSLTGTTSRTQYNASSSNTVSLGQELTIVIDGTPTAERLLCTIKINRTFT
jgi:hypothetical protein